MNHGTRNLTIRLLREGRTPNHSVRAGVILDNFAAFEGAKIASGSTADAPPAWVDFLGLSPMQRARLSQKFAYAILFLHVEDRWFAITFGFGHSKLDPLAITQDFGLRVVVNSIDHKKLRSADVRTPDANTLNRRSQTSRGSDRTVFEIDPERDIVLSLLGEPKDKTFGSKLSGSDALTLRRKAVLADLPSICRHAFNLYLRDDYKTEFGWIDQIRHVREQTTLAMLRQTLVQKLNNMLNGDISESENTALAYPTIYDPDRTDWVRFRGYRSSEAFPELDIAHYLGDLKSHGITSYVDAFLETHLLQECDETKKVLGQSWSIKDCFVFDTRIDGENFTLSAGRWYRIEADLAREVTDYFAALPKVELPPAHIGDNEKTYNTRIKERNLDLLCMDTRLLKPSGAFSQIEFCDFLSKSKQIIHIKDKASSSRLSHLFNQGLTSALVLKRDTKFRDRLRELIAAQYGGNNYIGLVPDSNTAFVPSHFTVVFGVLMTPPSGTDPTLPFFSLISLRHTARRITDELGFKVAFAWIRKSKKISPDIETALPVSA
jgi:uncharacterized protein (TIGR04141 family)